MRAAEVRDLSERGVVKLATERKHLTDIIKMVAWRTGPRWRFDGTGDQPAGRRRCRQSRQTSLLLDESVPGAAPAATLLGADTATADDAAQFCCVARWSARRVRPGNACLRQVRQLTCPRKPPSQSRQTSEHNPLRLGARRL
jgi:hypothetical protein